MTTLDVAIIGAGISGINTAYRVQEAIPGINYTIFESRNEIGGTWSFFKYPGLRSDSDLFSFGFEWNPWESDEVIADAESIMTYLNRSLDLFGGREKLALGHRLEAIDWSSKEQVWTLKFKDQPDVRARWVVLGTGYYDYENALPASIPGLDKFKGTIVHPQFWPEDLDLTNKRVAIIGSGATAITILPSIVDQAAHVTMIQRSPSFVGKLPRKDAQAQVLKRWLPLTWATRVLRLKYLALSWLFFNFCQRFPQRARKAILKETKKSLPSTIPVDPHFEPKYQPWDQRFCMCPDGDFYNALRSGKANIITGHIESMTESSIQIKDQPESTIDADIIVTATGLKILVGGGADVSVDGVPFSPPDKMIWKGCMLQDVPNALVMIGYTNASWTLGADVAAKTLTRLLKRLKDESLSSATPVAPKDINTQPFMKMQSTYLLKGKGDMPMGGDRYPWLPRGSYFSDIWDATFGDITTDLVLKPRA